MQEHSRLGRKSDPLALVKETKNCLHWQMVYAQINISWKMREWEKIIEDFWEKKQITQFWPEEQPLFW